MFEKMGGFVRQAFIGKKKSEAYEPISRVTARGKLRREVRGLRGRLQRN